MSANTPEMRTLARRYADATRNWDKWMTRAQRAEARVAAVLAMCDEAEQNREAENCLWTAAIRATLSGSAAEATPPPE